MSDTVKYMVLFLSLSMLFLFISRNEISNRILNGMIVQDILYPVNLIISLFFKSPGNAMSSFITGIIPTFIILTVLFRPAWDFVLINFLFFMLFTMPGFITSDLLALFAIWLIVLKFNKIQDWTFGQIVFIFTLAHISYRIRNLFSGQFRRLNYMIADGTLDTLLLKPYNIVMHLPCRRIKNVYGV